MAGTAGDRGRRGVADAWNIATDGIETHYAAGVRSTAGSWHDFLYGGFDPHGLISLDKLPATSPQINHVLLFS
jgi:hypothetical protein